MLIDARRQLTLLLCGTVLALFAMGCEGNQGPQGEQGPPGPEGPQGPAVGTTGMISGTVTNALTDAGLEGVTITVSPTVADADTLSDAEGAYAIAVPPGQYTVSYALEAFGEHSEEVVVAIDATETRDVALDPDEPVAITIEMSGTAPGGQVSLMATVVPYDGSSVESYAWSQTGGVAATPTGAENAATEIYTLGNVAAYKSTLIDAVNMDEEGGDRTLDRLRVVAINPFDLEHAQQVSFELEVTTTSGTYSASISPHTELDEFAAVSSGLTAVPTGLPVLLQGKDGVTWAWSLISTPVGSAATLGDATSQYPFFTPDVAGDYVVEQTGGGDTITVTATTWIGAIGGQTDGLPNGASDCVACHQDGGSAPDMFTPWRESGHAHIFSTELDTRSSHLSERCFSCHSVGFNMTADNNGLDDAADYPDFLDAGYLNNPGDNWTSMLANQPMSARLANVQCESCHGPNGASGAHPDVTNTVRTSIASEVCASCHGEPKRHARYQQWQLSPHANYSLALSRGMSTSCARCHSGQGFLAWLPQLMAGDPGDLPGGAITWDADSVEPQTCVTCHDPHNAGDKSGKPNNAVMRIEDNTPMLPGGFQANGVGRGAICITCHNSRRGLYNDFNFEISGLDPDRAPHGSVQGDVLMGQNAFYVTIGARSPHSFIPDTCANCHMEATPPPPELSYNLNGTNHTFRASEEICAECHNEKLDFHQLEEGFEAQAEALKMALEAALVAEIEFHTAKGREVVTGDESVLAGDTIAVEITESRGRQAMNITVNGVTETNVALDSTDVLATPGDDGSSIGSLLVNSDVDNQGEVLIKSGWNYWLMHSDGSHGAHNPAFAFTVLEAARNALAPLIGPM